MVDSFSNSQYKHYQEETNTEPEFRFLLEQFADLKILRYQVPEFEILSLKQKELIWCLSEAALSGRDIIFSQNGRYNLAIRRTLENIFLTYTGNRNQSEWEAFVVYLKRVWFSNGIHHHYASTKIEPGFTVNYFMEIAAHSNPHSFPLKERMTVDQLIELLIPVIFNPEILPKKVSLDTGSDLVKNSAVNFYENVSEKDAEDFYHTIAQTDPARPLSLGLNSKLVKNGNKISEITWKIGGMYSSAIEKIVYWLKKAAAVAENELQKHTIEKLIEYYETGDLKTWDEYNVLWVSDKESVVDFVNGFIESYEDPLGRKGTWESVVNFKDLEATKRAEILSENAQWFEDHSPVDEQFKKKKVKGVTAKVITVAQLAGDCYPSTPIGINLPNADWIRKEHGSKSVTIENITYAYEKASQGNGMLEEFVLSEAERELSRRYASLAGNVHTDMHECLGHGSGQLMPGVSADALRNYQSTLEETRADLFALYYILDPKMLELKILPSEDAAIAEYNAYIRGGLITQLTRIAPGHNLEEAHMRNRQLIAKWCFVHGQAENVIDFVVENDKKYVCVNDHHKLRKLFGTLLAEIQRVKSEGDYEAGKALVEEYGVKVDRQLHEEVLERFRKLNIAPYSGFINPDIKPVFTDGKISDIEISYSEDYTAQMLHYSNEYSFLPTWE